MTGGCALLYNYLPSFYSPNEGRTFGQSQTTGRVTPRQDKVKQARPTASCRLVTKHQCNLPGDARLSLRFPPLL